MNAIVEYWLKNHSKEADDLPGLVFCVRVHCADGFSISIQASKFHCCVPREYLPDGNYSAWELGFPSETEPLILEYQDSSPRKPTETIYPFVPTDVVNAMIAKHGGLKENETIPYRLLLDGHVWHH